jgi:hypothetical protein
MPANKLALEHHEVEVEYTIGLTPSAPALIYKDGSSAAANFTSAEITTDETAFRSFASVPLVRAVDPGGERFGFVLPQLEVAQRESEHFTTVGVYERFGGTDSALPLAAITGQILDTPTPDSIAEGGAMLLPALSPDPLRPPVDVQQTTIAHDLQGRWVCDTWSEAIQNGGRRPQRCPAQLGRRTRRRRRRSSICSSSAPTH